LCARSIADPYNYIDVAIVIVVIKVIAIVVKTNWLLYVTFHVPGRCIHKFYHSVRSTDFDGHFITKMAPYMKVYISNYLEIISWLSTAMQKHTFPCLMGYKYHAKCSI
jgi:hypothetical protein